MVSFAFEELFAEAVFASKIAKVSNANAAIGKISFLLILAHLLSLLSYFRGVNLK
jgi:hypothetical protein